jgi:hypothetical protein
MDPPYHIVDYKPRKDQDFYFYDKLIENNLYQSLFADTTNNYILRMYSLFEEDTVSKSIPDTLTKKAAQKQKVQIRDKLANNLYYNKPKYLQVYTEQGELKADFQVPDGTKVINAVPGKIWLAQERTKPNGDLRVYEYAYEDILEHSSLSNRE